MKGWFDAFRHDGGPTLYDAPNRTAVTGDVPVITLCVVFITLFAAFLIVFPGIRKERFTTFISVTLSLFVGAVIVAGNFGSEWHVAQGQITSAYRSFSSEKILANLGVHVGLNSVNVTLRSPASSNSSERVDYNERFCWLKPDDMHEEFHGALAKGLPYPILTVAEYLSLDEEGFSWGRKYRNAGYYTCITLWSAFASWFLMNIFLLAVPRYGAYAMLLTGSLMIASNLIYFLSIPHRALVIRFESVSLVFSFGWTYWLVLGAGFVCIVAGFLICLMECLYPNKFSTILEIDYGTPYDRHIIIEESHDRKHKPSLEQPSSLSYSSKIFRRFSRRSESSGTATTKSGIDNPALEMENDPPKSPWRYPQHRILVSPARSESRRSTKSVNFGNTLHPSSASSMNLSAEQFQLEPLAEANNEEVLPKSSSQSTWISSDDGEDEIERVGTVVVPTAADFQRQFRNSHVSRTGSRMSRTDSQVSRAHSQASRGSRTRNASPSISGSSTPVRKISGDSDVSDDIVNSISARISAVEEAAAQFDRHSGDEIMSQTSVDMW